jgi:Uma2 family endonuclease
LTREEAYALVDLGFPNAEKLELIEGELIDRKGKEHLHNLSQTLILEWLRQQFGSEFVQVEPSIYVSLEDNLRSEPEPDLIVTAHSIRTYSDNVTPSEIRLLIEVSDSTVTFDLGRKASLYARAGIGEYWVIDIPDQVVHVHRGPAQGAYTSIVKRAFSETISPLAKPVSAFCMDKL